MWTRAVSGALIFLLGTIWILQGFDIAKGSGMSGHAIWAVLGVVLMAIGVVLLRAANGARRSGP
jgi:hypothetical protein